MTQPQLRVRGAARGRATDPVTADVSDDDDPPPPLEPMDTFQPPLPVIGRARVVTPARFAIYRTQGTSTADAAMNVTTEVPNQRRISFSSSTSTDSGDDSPSTTGYPAPNFALPWRRESIGNMTCLEQYLAIVVDGERLLFRITICIERITTTVRPSVHVNFLNSVRGTGPPSHDVWMIFAAQLETTLLGEVERAFRRVAAGMEAGL